MPTSKDIPLHYNILANYGASVSEIQELLTYNENRFNHGYSPGILPREAEPHVLAWQQYVKQSQQIGTYAALKECLVQFQFPIKPGISQTQDYYTATRQGKSVEGMSLATGLIFSQPEQLRLLIHQTLAGPIPVIITGNRADFITLVQALTKRNEPHPVPDSMGACIVGGYNNWDRIRQYKERWMAKNPKHCSESDWSSEFQRLIKKKELYQDRFILLSPGNYSHVSASKLGLTETDWLELSLKIRLEHECTHYITRRWFGSMHNNLHDELIADYRGIVAVNGYYRADWLLYFLGLESEIEYRKGGRIENYRGDPPLTDGAFKILQRLVKTAAKNLEQFEQQDVKRPRTLTQEIELLFALTKLRLEELASIDAIKLLNRAMEEAQERMEQRC